MRRRIILVRLAFLLCLVLGTASGALAQGNNAVGLWKASFAPDNDPNMPEVGSQDICIRADGTWRGTTFPNWGGRWFQKGVSASGSGDHVRLFGNYANGVGNDSFELDFVNNGLMTGTWTEWRDDLGALIFNRVAFRRTSVSCDFIPGFTAEDIARADREKRNPAGPPAKQ